MGLAEAVDALAANDLERLLRELLEAWRAVRHPRIADAIDFVSDELTAQRAAVAGKTVAARTRAWHEIEQQRDPADLGRLLATPWPGTWKPALAMLTPLVAWPDDPRIARAFAELVERRPYDTSTSKAFYRPLFDRLEELRDLRALAYLRRAHHKAASASYLRDVRPREQMVLTAFAEWFPDAAPPALTADAITALERIEERYAARIAAAKELAASSIDHLTAIYEAPDDLAPRAVFADFLQEQGDPRGDFIALQLARLDAVPSDAAVAREHALLAAHGDDWVGTLAPWFVAEGRVFHAGFFAGGHACGAPEDLDACLADPAWAVVRTIAGSGVFVDSLLAAPELRSLCEVDVAYEDALALADDSPRSLTALRFEVAQADLLDTSLAHCNALPALREIAITSREPERLAPWVTEATIVERLERLVLRGFDTSIAAVIDAAAQRGGALREIELGYVHPRHGDTGWRFVLQRDAAPGPFTRFVARPRSVAHRLEGLADVIERVPATLRELAIATPKPLDLPKSEQTRLGAAVARFTALAKCELPWPLDAVPIKPTTKQALAIELFGEPLFTTDKVPAVWQLVNDELDLAFDSFDVGAKWRSLGKDPLARVLTWAGNARCFNIHVFRDGTSFGMWLHKQQGYRDEVGTTVVIPVAPSADMIAWLLRFCELGTFTAGHAAPFVDSAALDLTAFDMEDLQAPMRGGWLTFVDANTAKLLPIAEVRTAGLAAYPSGTGYWIATAPSLAELTTSHLVAATRKLTRIMRDQHYQRLGYNLQDRAAKLVDPTARSLGLVPYDDPDRPRSLSVRYIKPNRPMSRIEIALYPGDEPCIVTNARYYYFMGTREYRNTETGGTLAKVPDRAALDAALIAAAAELPALVQRI